MHDKTFEKDCWRVWFEYLIRTPSYLKYCDYMEKIFKGKDVPFPKELEAFVFGYSNWWNHDWPHEFNFEKAYWRLRRWQAQKHKADDCFNNDSFIKNYLAEEISREASNSLNFVRERKKTSLLLSQEERIIQISAKRVLNNAPARIKEWRETGFGSFRYKGIVLDTKIGPSILAVLKRRLTYYHLESILGFTRNNILRGELGIHGLPLGASLPFGPGPFLPTLADGDFKPKQIDYFLYWRPEGNCPGFDGFREPAAFVSEEISEARKTISFVESGWFPRPPKS